MPGVPTTLWIARHGESAGNVAWAAAEAAGHHLIDVSARDADVPLSARGVRQAEALGRWFAGLPEDQRPTHVYASPYARAHETAKVALAAGGLGLRVHLDERLREKEFGALNRMTRAGIVATMPEQAELRQTLGKFYYRPPGGESWCDIILRLRSFYRELREDCAGARVLVVCHSVITMCMRYLVEELDEERLLALDAAADVANCGLTTYAAAGDRLALVSFNVVAPLEAAGEAVTDAPDAPRPK